MWKLHFVLCTELNMFNHRIVKCSIVNTASFHKNKRNKNTQNITHKTASVFVRTAVGFVPNRIDRVSSRARSGLLSHGAVVIIVDGVVSIDHPPYQLSTAELKGLHLLVMVIEIASEDKLKLDTHLFC